MSEGLNQLFDIEKFSIILTVMSIVLTKVRMI